MLNICVISNIQQQAEALGTQFQPIHVLYNDKAFTRNLSEMRSYERIIYRTYSAVSLKQEIFEIRRMIHQILPDAIYVNSFPHLLIAGINNKISHSFSKKPVILATSHTPQSWENASKRLIMAFLLSMFADGIFTLAQYQEKWLRKMGISPQRIKTISNAVDVEQFSPNVDKVLLNPPDSPILINVATITPRKCQETLIRAIKLVKKDFPRVRLLFTGNQFSDKSYGNFLESIINEHGVGQNVNFIGKIEHDQIPQLLSTSDISLLSSLSEVCPFSVIESLATGLVTIATSVGGVPDLIDDRSNGFLVKPKDVNGFADIIIKVLKNPALKQAIEKNARDSALNNFSYQVVGKKHKDFLLSIL
jgi:glycosyltransferase involved in cell wall biosynthesis